jgi:hypothetical protein
MHFINDCKIYKTKNCYDTSVKTQMVQ